MQENLLRHICNNDGSGALFWNLQATEYFGLPVMIILTHFLSLLLFATKFSYTSVDGP
jgi:hypothetical protein